jgi:hypothetical protein
MRASDRSKPCEADILLAASRGGLSRYRLSGKWTFTMNTWTINKRRVLDLMRRELLEPRGPALPCGLSQRIEITIKGRQALHGED